MSVGGGDLTFQVSGLQGQREMQNYDFLKHFQVCTSPAGDSEIFVGTS